MRAYRHGSHTVFQRHYHFLFIPKYRKPILRGEVGQNLREIIREVCKARDIEILQGHIRPDHVHLLLSVPPTLSPSRVMNAIKGRSSNRLMRNFRTLNRTFWGRHLWARGYFVATSGNVTDEVIAKYIAEQDVEADRSEERRVGQECRCGMRQFEAERGVSRRGEDQLLRGESDDEGR